ncbi:MAG TPA: ankyrin repeat domain-containing protein, partial [Burkholderiaceae bacterium]|nr:ankyrin repeat domain-containing protein [Burkholderiaceae bacterium]
RRTHGEEETYSVDEIHYINGYRNYLAASMGLTERPDSFVPTIVGLHLEEARRFVSWDLTADALIRHMAEECLAEVREHFKDYIDRPLDEDEGCRVYKEYEKSLELGLQSRYGKIDCSVVLSASNGKGTEDAPYTLIDHPALLMRAIARNLMDAGLLEKEKFALEASDPNGQSRFKRITEDMLYVKEEENFEVRYRNVELEDADRPGLSPESSMTILKSALMWTTDRNRLRLVDPQRVWDLMTDAQNGLPKGEADWIDAFIWVNHYRDAHPDGNEFLIRKAEDKLAGSTPEHRQEVLGRLIEHREDALGARVVVSLSIPEVRTLVDEEVLHRAAGQGCDQVLNELVSKVPTTIDNANFEGQSALIVAAGEGKTNCVRILLQHNAHADLQDNFGMTALMYAATNGHLPVVQELLKADIDFAAKDEFGLNALHHAAAAGRTDLIEILVRSDGSINERTNDGATALMLAASNGRLDTSKKLLGLDADPNVEDDNGETALHAAAKNGHVDIIEILQPVVTDLDKGNATGKTPLMLAALNRHRSAVLKLLALDANPNCEDDEKQTSLHAAAAGGNPDIIEILQAVVEEPDKGDVAGATPLMVAAFEGHTEAVRKFLGLRADADRKTSHGVTPLHEAAAGGNPDIIEILQPIVTGLEERCSAGNTPLMVAASLGRSAAVRKLLELGADPTLKNDKRQTLLHISAAAGNPEIIEIPQITATGLNESDITGGTPLMFAALHGHLAAVRKLLSLGADPRVTDSDGISAFHSAAKAGSSEIIEELLPHVSHIDESINDGRSALELAVHGGHLDAARTLLRLGAGLSPDDYGYTLLHVAAVNGDSDLIKVMGEYVENIDELTPDSRSPLMLAAALGHADAVERLLNLGANRRLADAHEYRAFHLAAAGGHTRIIEMLRPDASEVDAPTRYGTTALMMAAGSGRIEAAQCLMDRGANIEATDWLGWTPLHHAVNRSEMQMVHLLLQSGANLYARTANNGESVLSIAIRNECLPLVQLFSQWLRN